MGRRDGGGARFERSLRVTGAGARFERSLGVTGAGAAEWHGKRLRRGSEV